AMMKLSSSWPSGRMFALSDSGVTSRASFSAEFNGGRATDDTDLVTDWIITSMSRAISSPDGSTGTRGCGGGGGGGGVNSIRGCGAMELTAAVAVKIGSKIFGGSCGGT